LERKQVLIGEIAGIFFIFLFGALFHFIYELSGKAAFVAIMGAANESTWEHIKIGFWPAFIFAVIEFFVFGKRIRSFFFAKAVVISADNGTYNSTFLRLYVYPWGGLPCAGYNDIFYCHTCCPNCKQQVNGYGKIPCLS